MEATTAIIKHEIALDGQILFEKYGKLLVGKIVELKEEAVRVDYEIEPFNIHSPKFITVYGYSCWIPKNIIETNADGLLIVKSWFGRNFSGGKQIKKYYIQKGKKIYL